MCLGESVIRYAACSENSMKSLLQKIVFQKVEIYETNERKYAKMI